MFCLKIVRTMCPCFFQTSVGHNLTGHQQQENRLKGLNKRIELPDLYEQRQTQYSTHASQTSRSRLKQQQVLDIQQIESNANSYKLSTTSTSSPVKKAQMSPEQSKKMELHEVIEHIDYTKYINKQNPYYEILQVQLGKLNGIFNISHQGSPIKPLTSYNLEVRISQSEDKKTNIFAYSFELPTNYAFYQHIQSDFDLQKSFDANIDSYNSVQTVNQQTKVVYLSYKRVLIIAPRDFVYVRYIFTHENQHWSIATSNPHAQTYQGKCRGDIILTATRVIPVKNGIQVSVYSQVDMKISIKGDMARNRGVQQIKKYLDKTYKHIMENGESLLDSDLNL